MLVSVCHFKATPLHSSRGLSLLPDVGEHGEGNVWPTVTLMENRLWGRVCARIFVCLRILEHLGLNHAAVAMIEAHFWEERIGAVKDKAINSKQEQTVQQRNTWARAFSLRTHKGSLCDVILWSHKDQDKHCRKGKRLFFSVRTDSCVRSR